MTVSSVSRSIKLVQFVLIILISIVTVWANIYLFNFTLQQDEYEHTSLVPYLVNFVFLLVTISVTYWYIGSVIVEDVTNIIHTTSNVLFFAILLLCSQRNLKTIRLEMAFSITYIVLSSTLILLICLKSKNRSLPTNSLINHNDGDFVIPIDRFTKLAQYVFLLLTVVLTLALIMLIHRMNHDNQIIDFILCADLSIGQWAWFDILVLFESSIWMSVYIEHINTKHIVPIMSIPLLLLSGAFFLVSGLDHSFDLLLALFFITYLVIGCSMILWFCFKSRKSTQSNLNSTKYHKYNDRQFLIEI